MRRVSAFVRKLLLSLVLAGLVVASYFPAIPQAFAGEALVAAVAGTRKVSKKAAAANVVPDDSENELYEGREDLPGENFSEPWPSVTRIADMLPARTVKDGPGEWIYETQHFRFVSDAPLALSAVKEIARIFEGTYTANLALPIDSPCGHYQVCERGRFIAQLFEHYDDYIKAGGHEGSAGVFIWQEWRLNGTLVDTGMEKGRVLVPFRSLGLEKRGPRYVRSGRKIEAKTLAHEITHHMTCPGANLPKWLAEGLAEYVGLSYEGNGQTRFSGNRNTISKFVSDYGENRAGGRAIGKKPQVDATLQQFLTGAKTFPGTQSDQVNYGVSALLVYYFFHLDGKRDAARIKKYIAALHRGISPQEASACLLDGRDWAQLEKEICRRLKSTMKIEPQFDDGVEVAFPPR